ncbi:SNF2-related protein [Vulcanisaeta thermophila]|uniref:SNF2-related protein n=1 Tax=Vulcanisaeta thermophila TaxID=867917 RepID=UPI000853760F|nr:DEAD/DEAH box helicase [Vulcanisaeta thermophila]
MPSLVEILRDAKKDLYKHQLDFVSDIILLPNIKVLLADDVGLGKTIQALLLTRVLMDLERVNTVLIIVPRAVFSQWSEELENFGIEYYPIESENFPIGHRVYLITLDRAKLTNYLEKLSKLNWDLVVIDEAHKLRLDTQRVNIANLCREARNCLLLTATPHTGDETDYNFLKGLVNGFVIRREKKDVEEYEGRKIFPRLQYWVVQVNAPPVEARALNRILSILDSKENIENIVKVVVKKRAMSSPISFLTTLTKVMGGSCTQDLLEEGELDTCLGNVSGLKELREMIEEYAKLPDTKLEALKKLLFEMKGLERKKVLIFTEYATTAEYLFHKLYEYLSGRFGGCRIYDAGEGFVRADCGSVGLMYATSKARGRIDVNIEAFNLAKSHEVAIFISTDIMSEGVNLQSYNVLINYEVVWSPTKHVQRIGRIWRFGQSADSVVVIDMVLRTGLDRDEYSYYMYLMEKLYEISMEALTPQSYGEYSIYKFDEGRIEKILEIGSSVYLDEYKVFNDVVDRRLDELRRKIKEILARKEELRWKPKSLVDEGLRVKLGYPPENKPEAGSGYYQVELRYMLNGTLLNKEELLIRLPTPLSKSREVPEVVLREIEVPWDNVEVEVGDVKEDEKSEVARRVYIDVIDPIKKYMEFLKKYVPLNNVDLKIGLIRRAIVKQGEGITLVTGDFESLVQREIRISKSRAKVELEAVKCAKKILNKDGYIIVEDYSSMPRPFDLVVSRNGVLYTVEVKGKRVERANEPISFTVNEIDWASKFPNRHIVCIAYVDDYGCKETECMTFEEFQRRWILETVRGIEYKFNARRKEN